jgi:MoaA/NifB/PqqE/SkfB family radical SAM enzyme
MRCRKCTIGKDPDAHKEPELSRDEFFRILSQLAVMGNKVVALWGGEPLLNRDLFDIIREIRCLGMIPYLVTNGHLLNEKNVQKLVDADVGSVSVSLDETDPGKHDEMRGVPGSFERSCSGLALVRKMGGEKVNIGINMVIGKDNIDEIPRMAKLASELDLNWLKFIPIHFGFPYNPLEFGDSELMPGDEEVARIRDNLLQARKFMMERGMYTNSLKFLKDIDAFFRGRHLMQDCYAGFLLCNIDAFGNINQCSIDSRIAGNLRKNSFKEIWQSGEFDRIRRDHGKSLCGHCWLSCFVEPSFRMSVAYSTKNLFQFLKETSFVR